MHPRNPLFSSHSSRRFDSIPIRALPPLPAGFPLRSSLPREPHHRRQSSRYVVCRPERPLSNTLRASRQAGVATGLLVTFVVGDRVTRA